MPLVQTRGAASAQGFGEFSQSGPVNYIEDVFSTYLYTGTSANQTITNNIDLSTNGGLVWIKSRSNDSNNALFNTVRGTNKYLRSNATDAETTASPANSLTAFNTNGFSLGSDTGTLLVNVLNRTYVSWTFREQPKFFDIVTYTGDGSVSRQISHNLGSTPGCIMVKATSNALEWYVQHRSLASTNSYIVLNSTAVATSGQNWGNAGGVAPTSTVFTVGDNANASGYTYVAYLFAHNAGGFGLSGTDNVISCGSYTGNGSTQQDITLGYEPQWLMIKRTDTVNSWIMVDNMRGFFQTADNALCANNAEVESGTVSVSGAMQPIATGFHLYNANSSVNASGGTYIYIAIRRGPMKVPTTGTSVYNAIVRNGTQANATVTGVGFPVDLDYTSYRPATHNPVLSDRLRGTTKTLSSRGTYAEQTEPTALTSFASMDGVSYGANTTDFFNGFNGDTGSYVNWFFRRSPSVFDIVCDTGTGAGHTISHNLGVAPQLMIRKRRDSTSNWCVYPNDITQVLFLDGTNAFGTNGATYWNSTSPTSSVFSIGTNTDVNTSAGTYVTYLFATCAGVSKVGSYTGNGTTQTIDCGFGAGGVRFVLIKRTDSAGNWYIYDTARGMTVLTDPYLLASDNGAGVPAETATLGSVTTVSTGFALDAAIVAAINTNAASYIFLAIA